MLRWKLAFVPFGINHPVWVEDIDFDLSHQVRRIACPAPGDQGALCELISELYAHPLDKSRPLWQAWIVEGLERDRVAFVLLLHHAYCDGAGRRHCSSSWLRLIACLSGAAWTTA